MQHKGAKSDGACALQNLTNLTEDRRKKGGQDATKLIQMLVPSLVRTLQRSDGDVRIRGDCCAALYNLAKEDTNAIAMLQEGVLVSALELFHVETPVSPSPFPTHLALLHQRHINIVVLNYSPEPGHLAITRRLPNCLPGLPLTKSTGVISSPSLSWTHC